MEEGKDSWYSTNQIPLVPVLHSVVIMHSVANKSMSPMRNATKLKMSSLEGCGSLKSSAFGESKIWRVKSAGLDPSILNCGRKSDFHLSVCDVFGGDKNNSSVDENESCFNSLKFSICTKFESCINHVLPEHQLL